MQVAINIALVVSSLIMIVTVLMQSSDSDGLGVLTGQKETFFSQNKARSYEGKLQLATKISASAFVLLGLVSVLIA